MCAVDEPTNYTKIQSFENNRVSTKVKRSQQLRFKGCESDVSVLAEPLAHKGLTAIRDHLLLLVTAQLIKLLGGPHPLSTMAVAHSTAAVNAAVCYTLLHTAARQGNVPAVREYLRHMQSPAQVDATNHTGDTALLVAAHAGHDAVVNQLLQAGANVQHANTAGVRPFAQPWQGVGASRPCGRLIHGSAAVTS